ncbi:hypothetical protein SAMN05216203_1891 [Marinobacter daqiaonensis]|uniref:Uncharacterized protein n=1 Tax=Marinobacter daqiaonensis TaxID=650891 RepID=A0A1I6I7H2_9GAMM|nr:DUF6231 family protein [Marinobacter daqiaonensis]SFR62330.1 hypothetical protein SAMN05216203_1891 [Marinobacter daqiaonensis]
MNAQALFQAMIEDCQPGSLLAAGHHARAAAERWHQYHPDATVELLEPTSGELTGHGAVPHDLAIISDTLEELDPRQGSVLLGQLRNLGNRQIAALISNSSDWAFTDFIALGFVRQGATGHEEGFTLYTYNIDTYNRKRDWNNPRNWANPEMWGKARW